MRDTYRNFQHFSISFQPKNLLHPKTKKKHQAEADIARHEAEPVAESPQVGDLGEYRIGCMYMCIIYLYIYIHSGKLT